MRQRETPFFLSLKQNESNFRLIQDEADLRIWQIEVGFVHEAEWGRFENEAGLIIL